MMVAMFSRDSLSAAVRSTCLYNVFTSGTVDLVMNDRFLDDMIGSVFARDDLPINIKSIIFPHLAVYHDITCSVTSSDFQLFNLPFTYLDVKNMFSGREKSFRALPDEVVTRCD
jgi:hypothetical protein